ncbi:MAG: pentapeptide repeat-containing protein [Ignavibacteriae bacterium]|nr:pentapeptide repeat-containing protein [Ignavibacteriota bacterium]
MNNKLKSHLDKIFGPYADLNNVKDLKEELYSDLLEKMNDFISQGNEEETALEKTINSIGDVSELIDEICDNTRKLQFQAGMDFSMSALKNSDMSNTTIIVGKFNYSDMAGTNFNNSVLTGSKFKCTSLTDCSFNGTDLTGVEFNKSDLSRAIFRNAKIENTKFHYSDLSGVSFEGLKIINANFDYAGLKSTSFKNTILINVSFKTDVKKTDFDGASMDKLTFAILKGYKANLNNVTILENI